MSDPLSDSAQAAGLIYVADDHPGLTRRRRGRGFSYHHPDGSLVDAEERARIEALVIPPAWKDIWICPSAKGHLQVTGRDEAGRKQYIYHEAWSRHRNEAKFERVAPFGKALPTLRARIERDLNRRALDRDKVIALALRIMDETLLRIGNDEYAKQNGSFGLTTLRDRHVSFDGAEVRFSFAGKSGQDQTVSLTDRKLARLIKACRDIPGYTLFQYHTENGKDSIDSGDVNTYLRETMDGPFSAKDFRTWGGTVLAAESLMDEGEPTDEKDAERAIREICKTVAAGLGNTVAVCRSYYIHPGILDAYREGVLLPALKRRHAGNTPRGLEPSEAAVLWVVRDKDKSRS